MISPMSEALPGRHRKSVRGRAGRALAAAVGTLVAVAGCSAPTAGPATGPEAGPAVAASRTGGTPLRAGPFAGAFSVASSPSSADSSAVSRDPARPDPALPDSDSADSAAPGADRAAPDSPEIDAASAAEPVRKATASAARPTVSAARPAVSPAATAGTAAITNATATGRVVAIRPSDNYVAAIKKLRPGDTLALHAGSYPGFATVDVSGTSAKPITIRAFGGGEPAPVLTYAGTDHNHWEIRGSHLIVEGLTFDTPATYSIRIRPPASGKVDDVTLKDLTFRGCGDGCVSANDKGATYSNIRMIDNLMLDAKKTPVYIGNHQGAATFHNFLFEGNVIDARSIVGSDVVGYGIEVKKGVTGAVLRNNYVVGARGPGIMTYGLAANGPGGALIERNIVIGSCTDPNILVGAGPATVRGNLSIAAAAGAIGVQDYGNWHRLFGLTISGNTTVSGPAVGFVFPSRTAGTGLADLVMTRNLASTPTGSGGYAKLPSTRGVSGNGSVKSTAAITAYARALAARIPSPGALKSLWPKLSGAALGSADLTALLRALAATPNRSANSHPRACG